VQLWRQWKPSVFKSKQSALGRESGLWTMPLRSGLQPSLPLEGSPRIIRSIPLCFDNSLQTPSLHNRCATPRLRLQRHQRRQPSQAIAATRSFATTSIQEPTTARSSRSGSTFGSANDTTAATATDSATTVCLQQPSTTRHSCTSNRYSSSVIPAQVAVGISCYLAAARRFAAWAVRASAATSECSNWPQRDDVDAPAGRKESVESCDGRPCVTLCYVTLRNGAVANLQAM